MAKQKTNISIRLSERLQRAGSKREDLLKEHHHYQQLVTKTVADYGDTLALQDADVAELQNHFARMGALVDDLAEQGKKHADLYYAFMTYLTGQREIEETQDELSNEMEQLEILTRNFQVFMQSDPQLNGVWLNAVDPPIFEVALDEVDYSRKKRLLEALERSLARDTKQGYTLDK